MSSRSPSAAWFEQLFGFREQEYAQTQGRFALERSTLRSSANGRSFAIGTFTTPTLASLRAAARTAQRGTLSITHETIGDVLELHARPENRGAMFQVASQFNCLEFASPSAVPEQGVTDYATDPTQGPACSLAAAAATVYRNYFVPIGGIAGQTRDRQLDTLDGLAATLGAPGEYWRIVNGYTQSDEGRLARLAATLARHDREALLGAVKIGLHTDVGVDFSTRFVEPPEPSRVSQAFCSAISCGYTDVGLDHWAPLATLVLDAAYEATLLAALLATERPGAARVGPRKVWLTFLGGGVFGNRNEWIGRAIGRALARVEGMELDVRIAHYKSVNRSLEREVADARLAELGRGPRR